MEETGAGGNFLTILHQFFHTVYLRKRRGHGSYAPCACLGGMLGQPAAALDTCAAHVYNHLEVCIGFGADPRFCQFHALVFGEHVTFARGAVDEHAFQAVSLQHGGISRYGSVIYFPFRGERGERGVYKSFYLFHFLLI